MKRTRVFSTLLCGLFVLELSSFIAFGETKTLRATADTTLHEINPDNNMGAHTHVSSGSTGHVASRSRGLFKFDLAGQIPADATIESAVLTLQVTLVPPNGANSVFELHRVLQPWGEGTKSGNLGTAATIGEATWNSRMVPTAWSSPGASTPGDFAAAMSTSTPVSGVGSYNFGSSATMVADVQAWLNNPNSNFGWILISQSESVDRTARRFGSREDTANAPTLTITFSAPTTTVKPTISAQPQSQTVNVGSAVTFSVAASGSAPLSYQWKFNGSDIAGATSATLTLPNVQPSQAGDYSVAVSNAAGSVTSATAKLVVIVPITITQQPQSQTVNVGSAVTFSVSATGSAPLSYQWKFNGSDIAGATSATLTLPNVQPSQAGEYSVVVSNATGSIASASAMLVVNVPVVITQQPPEQTVIAGATVVFSVMASGTAPLSYQWKFNDSDIAGATSATLSLPNVQPNQAGDYSVVISNAAGSITSATAKLVVIVPVVITQQPQSQTVNACASVSFSVTATGTTPLSYQWKFNGNDISGAINSTLTLTNAQVSDAGAYRVSVSNTAGALLSAEAMLTVNAVADIPPRFDRIERDRDTIRILFTVEPTYALALESIDSLSLTNWITRTNFTAKIEAIKAVVTDSSSASPQRFYRLRITGRVR